VCSREGEERERERERERNRGEGEKGVARKRRERERERERDDKREFFFPCNKQTNTINNKTSFSFFLFPLSLHTFDCFDRGVGES